MTGDDPRHLLTVDLEEWFVVESLRDRVSFDDWPSLPSTIVSTTELLLDLFATQGVTATFFILGWCAERFPALMREVVAAGHDIGCHSYAHRRVDQLTPEAFREDTVRAVDAIGQATGVRPVGYRAPTWSINNRTPWAFDILVELGFEYDSSLFPIKHDLYGVPNGPRRPFRMTTESGQRLEEIPASTVRWGGNNHPVGGGGYLRHAPYWYSRWAVRKLEQEGLPANVYLHPWEFDPNPPRLGGLSWLQRIRAYGSTDLLANKLSRLVSEFSFAPIAVWRAAQRRQPIGFERRSSAP